MEQDLFGRFKSIEKKVIVKDILDMYESNDIFNSSIYKKYGKYSLKAIINHFGSWNNMLIELNIPLTRIVRYPTRQEIIDDLKYVFSEENKYSVNIYREKGKYSSCAVKKYFGNYTKLLQEAGFSPSYKSYLYSDEELLEAIRNLYEEFGFINKRIITRELNIPNATIINRIGNIGELCNKLNVGNFQICNKFEYILNILKDIFQEDPIFEYTNSSLINPKTNYNLRIDAYFPLNNIAIEYDGEQHFKFKPLWHKTYGHFLYRQYLDKLKENILSSLNIKLIRFRFDEDISEKNIKQKLLNYSSNVTK